jgi:hypothetical protein
MSPGNSDGAYIFLDAAYIQRGLSKRPVQVTLAPLAPSLRNKDRVLIRMKLGIQKRQWFLLFLVLLLPLLLNAVAIWLKIGTTGILQLLRGIYQPSNPNLPIASLPDILSELLFNVAVLGLLSWLAIFVSNRAFFQKQGLIVKSLEILLMVLLVAKVFEVASGFFMPFAWLPEFYDQIGIPISPFAADWSRWFIFPVTVIILFVTLALSRNKSLEGKGIRNTVNAL